MKTFFDGGVLLHSHGAEKLYGAVKDLPIVDYHSHLSERDIAEDKKFSTITAFWLGGDHYKWRAMRACGIAEKYITGDASDYDKFSAYASVMPKLCGNPLYYWTHMELSRIFGIKEPLNERTAPSIYKRANAALRDLSVRKLLKMFGVKYIATTDDPVSPLAFHGVYDGVRVCPTFRPDRALKLDRGYLGELSAAWGRPIGTLSDFCAALEARLDFFLSKGCTIADISLESVPQIVSEEEAARIFSGENPTPAERAAFFSYGLAFLSGLYRKKGVVSQLHIGALRNVNGPAFRALGADTGYDVMRGFVDSDALAAFLGMLHERGDLPATVLYSLNANAIPALCTVAGSFPDVRIGAAWWFNDTLKGIRSHLETLAEYSVLGTSVGMLTDSRSFSSYCRFDFFRRILADFVAEKTESGEYDGESAEELLRAICYTNPKTFLKIQEV